MIHSPKIMAMDSIQIGVSNFHHKLPRRRNRLIPPSMIRGRMIDLESQKQKNRLSLSLIRNKCRFKDMTVADIVEHIMTIKRIIVFCTKPSCFGVREKAHMNDHAISENNAKATPYPLFDRIIDNLCIFEFSMQ